MVQYFQVPSIDKLADKSADRSALSAKSSVISSADYEVLINILYYLPCLHPLFTITPLSTLQQLFTLSHTKIPVWTENNSITFKKNDIKKVSIYGNHMFICYESVMMYFVFCTPPFDSCYVIYKLCMLTLSSTLTTNQLIYVSFCWYTHLPYV